MLMFLSFHMVITVLHKDKVTPPQLSTLVVSVLLTAWPPAKARGCLKQISWSPPLTKVFFSNKCVIKLCSKFLTELSILFKLLYILVDRLYFFPFLIYPSYFTHFILQATHSNQFPNLFIYFPIPNPITDIYLYNDISDFLIQELFQRLCLTFILLLQ